MSRVLITGGAGFIAHHFIGKILRETDWEVVTLDRLDYSGNLNRLHDLLMFRVKNSIMNLLIFILHDLGMIYVMLWMAER